MNYYKYHVFFCLNEKVSNTQCCMSAGAPDLFSYTKKRIKDLGLSGKGNIRINKAGCMNRCSKGPVLVVYPEGVWYHYEAPRDIDDIIECHLKKGEVVSRLQLRMED